MLSQPYELKHLSDDHRESMRRLMLEELLWSSRHNKIYASKHLTALGVERYPELLQCESAGGDLVLWPYPNSRGTAALGCAKMALFQYEIPIRNPAPGIYGNGLDPPSFLDSLARRHLCRCHRPDSGNRSLHLRRARHGRLSRGPLHLLAPDAVRDSHVCFSTRLPPQQPHVRSAHRNRE